MEDGNNDTNVGSKSDDVNKIEEMERKTPLLGNINHPQEENEEQLFACYGQVLNSTNLTTSTISKEIRSLIDLNAPMVDWTNDDKWLTNGDNIQTAKHAYNYNSKRAKRDDNKNENDETQQDKLELNSSSSCSSSSSSSSSGVVMEKENENKETEEKNDEEELSSMKIISKAQAALQLRHLQYWHMRNRLLTDINKMNDSIEDTSFFPFSRNWLYGITMDAAKEAIASAGPKDPFNNSNLSKDKDDVGKIQIEVAPEVISVLGRAAEQLCLELGLRAQQNASTRGSSLIEKNDIMQVAERFEEMDIFLNI